MSNSEPPIERFAELIAGFGANVQPGQIVELSASPGKEELARHRGSGLPARREVRRLRALRPLDEAGARPARAG